VLVLVVVVLAFVGLFVFATDDRRDAGSRTPMMKIRSPVLDYLLGERLQEELLTRGLHWARPGERWMFRTRINQKFS
jgi:hypothetical protein